MKPVGPLFVFLAGILGIVLLLGFIFRLVTLPWDFSWRAISDIILFGCGGLSLIKIAWDRN